MEMPKQSRLRRFLRRLLIVAGVALVLLVLVILAGYWRLSEGPISLDRLESRLERLLNGELAPLSIDLGGLSLRWSGWKQPLGVRATEVRLIGGDGVELASLSEFRVVLSLSGLLDGEVEPVALEFADAQFSVVRASDGSFELGLGKKADDTQQVDDGTKTDWVEIFLEPPDPNRPLGRLARFDIHNASLDVHDRLLGVDWGADKTHLMVERDGEGLHVKISLDPRFGADLGRVNVTSRLAFVDRDLHTTIEFDALTPAALAQLGPSLAPLQGFSEPFKGSIKTVLANGVELRRVSFELEGHKGNLAGSVDFTDGLRSPSGELTLTELKPWLIAETVPELAPLSNVRFPLRGSVDFDLSDLKVRTLQVDLQAAPGRLTVPGVYDRPLELGGISVKGSVEDEFKTIRLDEMRVVLGPSNLTVRLKANRHGNGYRGRLTGRLDELAVNRLRLYWPELAAGDAREWVVNKIPAGLVREVAAELALEIADIEAPALEIDELSGSFEFEGLTVDAFQPQPPIVGISGQGTATLAGLDFTVDAGRLNDIEIGRSDVSITGLNDHNDRLELDVNCTTSLKTALELISGEPLTIIDDSIIAAADVSGTAAARLKLGLPLSSDSRHQTLDLSVNADLQGFSWSKAPLDLQISDGDLSLSYEGDAISIGGRTKLNGVPASLQYKEHLDGAEIQRRVEGSIVLDDKGRRALGIPDQPFVSGPATVAVKYTARRDGATEVAVEIDLTDNAIEIERLAWSKAAGTAGRAGFVARSPELKSWSIDQIDVKVADLIARGDVTLDGDPMSLRSVSLETLEYAGTRVSGKITRTEQGGYGIRIKGERFDVTPLTQEQPVSAEQTKEGPEGEPTARPPVTIEVELDEVVFNDQVILRGLSGNGYFDGRYLQKLHAGGQTSENNQLNADWGPAEGGYAGSLNATDAGGVVSSMGWLSRFEGGELEITVAQPAPGEPLDGRFEVRNITLIESPVLANILRLGSLTGLLRSLEGEGLRFRRAEALFTLGGGKLRIKGGRVFGEGIGMTAEGIVDFDGKAVTVRGSVAPVATIQRAIGKIPLLGKVLTGPNEEGIIATLFSVRGPFDDLEVDAQGMSTLTPGITRELFKLHPDQKIPKDDEEPKEQG